MTMWPVLVERLVQLLPTLQGFDGVSVFDGPPNTSDVPTDYVTVGYVDDESAGTYATDRTNGYQVVEVGTVRCAFVAQTGDDDLPAMRARAFVLVGALEQAVRADQSLGVLSPDSTCVVETEVLSVRNTNGAAQNVLVTLTYSTRY